MSLDNIADAHSCRGFFCATNLFSTLTMTCRGFVDVCFLGVGQEERIYYEKQIYVPEK